MLTAKDFRKFLEDVPDETPIVCPDPFRIPMPVKHADFVRQEDGIEQVFICPMGAHLPGDVEVKEQVHSLPEKYVLPEKKRPDVSVPNTDQVN